jgi:hypothetical protein
MKLANSNIDSLRSLSEIFSPAHFNKIVRHNNQTLTLKKLKKHYPQEITNKKYGNILKCLYLQLQNDYRNEYFYKNNLLNKYLLQKYSLATTTVFNEFKIGNSIADFVLLNGTSRIFEIKSDLDDLNKLKKQLDNYKQFADQVYIVTSSKYIDKILLNYLNTSVGVIEFTQNNTFKEHKKATDNSSFFNHLTIFKTLRKAEYISIINDYFGYIPNVPNTKIFRACFELVSKIEVTNFQKMAFNKLKHRKIKCPELLQSNKTPFELKHICYTLDFSEHEYNCLHMFLHKTI